MKKTYTLFILFLFFTCSLVQAQSKWRELDQFVGVLSPVHNAAKAGDFKPLRNRSAELVKAATVLRNGTPPTTCKNAPDLIPLLDKVLACAKQIDNQVKDNSSGEALLEMLQAESEVLVSLMDVCFTK